MRALVRFLSGNAFKRWREIGHIIEIWPPQNNLRNYQYGPAPLTPRAKALYVLSTCIEKAAMSWAWGAGAKSAHTDSWGVLRGQPEAHR